MDAPQFAPVPGGGYLGAFQFGAGMSRAAVSARVHAVSGSHAFVSLGRTPGSGITGPCGGRTVPWLNCQALFQSGSAVFVVPPVKRTFKLRVEVPDTRFDTFSFTLQRNKYLTACQSLETHVEERLFIERFSHEQVDLLFHTQRHCA